MPERPRTLLAEIARQQESLPPSAARNEMVRRLEAGADCVVTGQQVGLFLGPGYSVYKAATCIAVARARNAVPIFWLQSEDHDIAEISSCRVLDDLGELAVLEVDGAATLRSSVAHRPLGAAVESALADLGRALEGQPHSAECLELLRRHYRKGETWVSAFAGAMAELFAEQGLIVFSPRTEAVAELAQRFHLEALERHDEITESLQDRCRELAEQGRPVSIEPRPDCPLSFFHPEGVRGPRYRPKVTSSGLTWPGLKEAVPLGEVIERVRSTPLCASTSALLRPVVQDALLSPLCYIAGPGEALYLQECPPLYRHFGVEPSEVLARGHFVCTDAAIRRRLSSTELGLSNFASASAVSATLTRMADEAPGLRGAELTRELLDPVLETLDRRAPALLEEYPGLEKNLNKSRRLMETAATRLGQALDRSRIERDEVRHRRVRYIQAWVCPEGIPQERAFGFPHFSCRYGNTEWIAMIMKSLAEHPELDPRPLRELSF